MTTEADINPEHLKLCQFLFDKRDGYLGLNPVLTLFTQARYSGILSDTDYELFLTRVETIYELVDTLLSSEKQGEFMKSFREFCYLQCKKLEVPK